MLVASYTTSPHWNTLEIFSRHPKTDSQTALACLDAITAKPVIWCYFVSGSSSFHHSPETASQCLCQSVLIVKYRQTKQTQTRTYPGQNDSKMYKCLLPLLQDNKENVRFMRSNQNKDRKNIINWIKTNAFLPTTTCVRYDTLHGNVTTAKRLSNLVNNMTSPELPIFRTNLR